MSLWFKNIFYSPIVKICDDGIDEDYELESLPVLVHFLKGKPTIYYGDLKQDDEIAEWIDAQSKVESKPKPKQQKTNSKPKPKKWFFTLPFLLPLMMLLDGLFFPHPALDHHVICFVFSNVNKE